MLKQCVSESLGTYLLVLIGPGSVVLTSSAAIGFPASTIIIAAVFGVTVGCVILLFGKYSGANINPAVTVAQIFARVLSSRVLIPYLASQILGGLAAGFTLWLAFSPSDPASLGSTKLATNVNPVLGLVLEVAGTFALALSTLVASTRIHKPLGQAVLVGVALFVLILLIGPLTGASLNPARSLGPAVFSGYYTDLEVYIIGPLFGGVLAASVFGLVTT